MKPAISLLQMGAVPTGPTYLDLAFGGVPPDDRNPVQNSEALPETVRHRVVVSPDDQWVPLAENGGRRVTAGSLRRRGRPSR